MPSTALLPTLGSALIGGYFSGMYVYCMLFASCSTRLTRTPWLFKPLRCDVSSDVHIFFQVRKYRSTWLEISRQSLPLYAHIPLNLVNIVFQVGVVWWEFIRNQRA